MIPDHESGDDHGEWAAEVVAHGEVVACGDEG